MNSQLEAYARQTLKGGLSQLPESHNELFKRMYSHKNLHLPIDEVVDNMPTDKLDWAMQQVSRGLEGIKEHVMDFIGFCAKCGCRCYRDDDGRFVAWEPEPDCTCEIEREGEAE